MRLLIVTLQRIRSMVALRRADRALDEELQFHLEMETQRLVTAGLSRDAAREAAVRSFGGVARHRDEARDARGISIIEDFVSDLRLGFRGFRQRPSFSA